MENEFKKTNQNKKRKRLLIMGSLILLIALVGITYAFFNYTRTGVANTLRVGRISFVSNNEETITLNNLFPIDPTDSNEMNDSTKVGTYSIDITGDTDYSGGIEYLVSTTDANIYTSTGKAVPITLDFTVDDLGTESSNYFTARDNTNESIYKRLVGDTLVGDQMLLVGYIVPNTTIGQADGVDGSITIKAYLDENNILISDTYDGTESDDMGTPNSMAEGKTVFTTTEWNSLQANGVSFKIKVEANEGIWVTGSLEEIMKTKNYDTTKNRGIRDDESSPFVSAQTGIDFGEISSDTNGKGVYMRAGTENTTYPILYYRGEVTDNNVVFANKCWKTVRTTDTGGVKLIYNGELSALSAQLVESDYTILTNTGSMTFDSTENVWTLSSTTTVGSSSTPLEISFSVPNGDGYVLEVFGNAGSSISGGMYRGTSGTYQQNNGFGGGGGQSFIASLTNYGTMATGDSIKVTYYGTGTSEQELVIKVRVSHPDESLGQGCDNKETSSQITLNISGTDKNTFEFSGTNLYKSPAYNGYMWGTVYEYSYNNWTSGAKFGSSFTWDGTNYTLVDVDTTSSVPSVTRHYSCNSSSATATCTDLRYVYYWSGSTTLNNNTYYITLQNGKGINDALAEMQTNTTSSNAKDKIETWYANNMTSYASKIEDTIYCNDRSMNTLGESTYTDNGWKADGNLRNYYSYYAPCGRVRTGAPSLTCSKNDRFTWKNSAGNQKLQYPVAMLSSDEIMLAGGSFSNNGTYYLNSGSNYWSLSPFYFINDYAGEFRVNSYGYLVNFGGNYTNGLRPVVSIKPGQLITKGTGTVADPYVIE